MEAVDPMAFEAWIGENFTVGGEAKCENTVGALRRLIVDAVIDPQATILSRAVAHTRIDEVQARMALALIFGFMRTQSNLKGERDVENI